MTKAFVYAGHPTVGNMVSDRLCAAGWHRVTDAGAADAVITYFTVQTALEDAYFGDNGIVQGAQRYAYRGPVVHHAHVRARAERHGVR